MNTLKKLFLQQKAFLESYGSPETRATYKGELNYRAGKLVFVLYLTAIIWLPCMNYDTVLHPWPQMVIMLKLGLTFLSIVLLLAKNLPPLRNRPLALITILASYLYLAAMVIAATSKMVSPYIGLFSFVMVIPAFAPLTFRFKVIMSSVSFVMFFVISYFCQMDFSDIAISYSLIYFSASYAFSVVIAKVQDNAVKRELEQITVHTNLLTQQQKDIEVIMEPAEQPEKDSQAESIEFQCTEYYLASMIKDVVSITKTNLSSSEVNFITDIDSTLPSVLWGDEVRLRQIILNLLSNAVKFTKAGSVTLTVKGKSQIGRVLIIISVIDTGIGIKQDDIGKLFSGFSQADLHKNTHETGLGLALSKRLANRMDGDITVESEYGKGTAFTLSIYQKIVNRTPIGTGILDEINEDLTETGFIAPTAKILVVDDVEINLKVAEGQMALFEMQIDTALSGREAIDRVQKSDYDIVFMDNMMPEMDGIEATAKIRALGFDKLVIIALTASTESDMEEMFVKEGMQDFLAKPIEKSKLNTVLTKWLPKDKIIKASMRRKASESAAFEIDGINTNHGICSTGGTLAGYISTLGLFSKEARQRIDQIRQCLKTSDIALFTTYVHGMKSALASIGAAELSEMAKKLEQAGRNRDQTYIAGNTDVFLQNLSAMLDRIAPHVQKSENLPQDDISEQLGKLKAALEAFNMGEIDAILNALPDCDLVRKIGEFVLMFEYDEAMQIIDESLSK